MPLPSHISSRESRSAVIAICSTFPCEALEEPLAFWMDRLNLPFQPAVAPFNQVFQQLLDPNSLLARNDHGVNVVVVRFEDWAGPAPHLRSSVDQCGQEFVEALRSAAPRSHTPWLVCFCPGISGSFGEVELKITTELAGLGRVCFVSSADLASAGGPGSDEDQAESAFDRAPFDELFFAALSSQIARKIHVLHARPFKAIVLDCDKTLWAGVCAEDREVRIDAPRRALQEFMVRQRDAGMLLCLCSKNIEEDIFAVFQAHPEMPLKREHLVAWRINWEAKSRNIKSLAEEIQTGLESIIFIDDDPLECAEVRARCPEVLTLRLPGEPEKIQPFLRNVWAFDRLGITPEDGLRAGFLKSNPDRESCRRESFSLGEFLDKLDLSVEISPPVSTDLARISQLTQRTNQFNFTTIRRSEADLHALCQPGGLEGLTVRVRDRFGDYGLVGTMLFQVYPDTLVVDTFLLSCRALGRGVEHKMMARLAEMAKARGVQWIEVIYRATGRSQPAFDFLNGVGAEFKRPWDGGREERFHFSGAGLTGDQFFFKIPTGALLDLAPGSVQAQAANSSGQPGGLSRLAPLDEPGLRIDSADLHRIATDLSDPSRVLQEIAARRRQRAEMIGEVDSVEAILRGHPEVRDVAVRLRQSAGRRRLAAYLVVDPKRSPRISGRLRYRLPNKLAIVHQSRSETDSLYREIFDEQVYLKHGIVLRDGDCVIDAGANIGLFTLFVQMTCKDTRVYAFEPSPPIFELLRLNCDLYAPGAKLFNCGLSDQNKIGLLTFHPWLSGSSGYHPSTADALSSRMILNRRLEGLVDGHLLPMYAEELVARASTAETFETPLRPLSEILAGEGIQRVHLLKIDVEKSELDLLRGIRAEHWKLIDQVVLEAHGKDLSDQAKALLEAQGYSVTVDQETLARGTDLFLLYAIHPRRKAQVSHSTTNPIPLPFDRAFGGDLLSAARIRSFVKKELGRLPGPFDVLFLDELPRTRSGTISDEDLPAPTAANAELDNAVAPPRNPIEEELAGIWQSVLGINQVGIDENFFDLGGHSVLATVLLSRVRDVFGAELHLVSLFNAPTVAGLAEFVETQLINQLDDDELARTIQSLGGSPGAAARHISLE